MRAFQVCMNMTTHEKKLLVSLTHLCRYAHSKRSLAHTNNFMYALFCAHMDPDAIFFSLFTLGEEKITIKYFFFYDTCMMMIIIHTVCF